MKLELIDVCKKYGNNQALLGVSYSFEPGIYGLLGQNGAGKSTLMGLITDNVKRDRDGGSILCDGVDILTLGRSFRKKVGYMPQQQGYYNDFSVEQFLIYISGLKSIKLKDAKKQIKELAVNYNFDKFMYKRMSQLSGGMRQRVLLAQALLGHPELLILDEPTAGLDPKERVNFRNKLVELAENRIIIVATHLVTDVECISNKILLMKNGKLICQGEPWKLIESLEGFVAEVKCKYSDIERLATKYAIGNLNQHKDGLSLRIVIRNDDVDKKFPDGATLIIDGINLDDLYLHYNGEN